MAITEEDRRAIQGNSGDSPEILAVGVADAIRISGFSKTSIYSAITEGRLRAVKHGVKTLILMDSLRQLVASLPPATFRASKSQNA